MSSEFVPNGKNSSSRAQKNKCQKKCQKGYILGKEGKLIFQHPLVFYTEKNGEFFRRKNDYCFLNVKYFNKVNVLW